MLSSFNTNTREGALNQVRGSKDSLSGPMFQSVRESSLPKAEREFHTPTTDGIERADESTVNAILGGPAAGETIKNEETPNMPTLNPKTNFRYQGD